MTPTATRSMELFSTRRLRRLERAPSATRPRCPDCAGPLVFGEGCHVCPVCGYSACEA